MVKIAHKNYKEFEHAPCNAFVRIPSPIFWWNFDYFRRWNEFLTICFSFLHVIFLISLVMRKSFRKSFKNFVWQLFLEIITWEIHSPVIKIIDTNLITTHYFLTSGMTKCVKIVARSLFILKSLYLK